MTIESHYKELLTHIEGFGLFRYKGSSCLCKMGVDLKKVIEG